MIPEHARRTAGIGLALGIVLALFGPAGCARQSQEARRPAQKETLEQIQVSADGTHFVGARTGRRQVIWGFNYDHDESGRLLEDYWEDEWRTVVEDFAEMKALGANVVRIHLQLGRFMRGPRESNAASLRQLSRLVRLAEATGVYLDVTGLGCYHKRDVPGWYDALEETARWEVQTRFWQAVARVCRESPAIFCYDLMNEPILPGETTEREWLTGELGGKYFVQRISLELAGRTREQVAAAWVRRLTAAVRAVDPRHLITVGVIPWAQVFPGAKPFFNGPEVGGPLDFVSVHFYPKRDDLAGSLTALAVYEVGKPLVIEEIFPLSCSVEEARAFIKESRRHVDGWMSFYWGGTIEENERTGGLKGAIVARWLREFRSMSPTAPR